MKKIITQIILFSCLLADTLPNDVRWVTNSKEYAQICENTFNRAYKKLEAMIRSDYLEDIPYNAFLHALKNNNSRGVSQISCSSKECIGYYQEKEAGFKVHLPKLSNQFIALLKKNDIKYNFASNLETYLSQKENFAIIVDIDETILDNSDYQIMLSETGQTYSPESWSDWVNEGKAKLVPGAKDFLDKVRQMGVRVIFISNRMHKNLKPTIKDFKKLKIFSKKDIFLLRIDRADKKTIRRAEVFDGTGRMADFTNFNVIAFLGDAYGDFPKDNDAYIWDLNYYLFPNPMYGKW